MSRAAKALILTWLMIALLIAGGIGFYLGRVTAPKTPDQNRSGTQPQGQQPTGGQQQPQGPNQGSTPSAKQGGQQPASGGQPPIQK